MKTVYEAVLGFEAAELEQREVGDMILMPEKNIQFKVVGILERSGTQDDGTIFVPLKTLQKIFNRPDEITTLGIKVKKGANSARLEEKMYQLPDVQIVSLAQVKDTIMKLISTAKVMVLSIALIAILIAMVGVINTILDLGLGKVPGDRHSKDHRGHALGHFQVDLDRDPDSVPDRGSAGHHPGLDSGPGNGCGHPLCAALRPRWGTGTHRL